MNRLDRLQFSFVQVVALLGGLSAAHADPQALSSDVPVTIEDAFPLGTGKMEFQGVSLWDHGPHEGDLVTLAPELKLGPFPGAQVEVETPYAFGNASGHNQGSFSFGGFYNLNDQSEILPAFAVHDDYSQGFGLNGGTSSNSLRLIATKSLGDPVTASRLHLNVTWIHVTDPEGTNRRDLYEAAAGYSQLVSDHTALVVDYVRQENSAHVSDTNLIEAGFRHEIADNLAISAGAGVGIGPESPDFRLLTSIQYDFTVF